MNSRFGLILKDGTTEPVPQEWIDEWCRFYPQGMVEATIRTACSWSLDNPSKRKTKKGMRRFLGAWIRRDAERMFPQSADVGEVGDSYRRRN